MTTGLISCLPGPIRHHHYPINIAVQRCAALLGFLGPINTCLIDATVAALVRDKVQRVDQTGVNRP